MLVSVRIVGDVQWDHHLSAFQLVVEEGMSVGALLALLGVGETDGEITINGRDAGRETLLKNGDDVTIGRRGEFLGPVPD